MAKDEFSRRDLLLASSVGLAAILPQVLEAQEHAHQAMKSGAATLGYFDQATAAEIEAIAAQIIPTDETPGAREAGVIYFIDRALTTFDKDKQDEYRDGLAEVQKKRAAMFPASKSIATLAPADQLALVTAIDRTSFFELMRTHTIMGFLSIPSRGGNRNLVGWKMMGVEGTVFKPPFGYYDAKAREEGNR
jgi:gluconate 2-dehydrogenase gamma chain